MRQREKIDLTMAFTPSSVQRTCAGGRCSVTEAEPGRREPEGEEGQEGPWTREGEKTGKRTVER